LTEEEFTPLFEFLIKKGIIEVEIDKTLYFPYVSKHLGTEVDSAERVRKHREKKKEDSKLLHCNTEVTKSNTEIELEIEIDTKKDKIKPLVPKGKTFDDDSIEINLVKHLYGKMLINNPNAKKPNYQSWAREFDRIMRIDDKPFDEVLSIILWCQQDSFWKSNILSPKKLRDKYDQLYLKMNSTNNNKVEKVTFAGMALKEREDYERLTN